MEQTWRPKLCHFADTVGGHDHAKLVAVIESACMSAWGWWIDGALDPDALIVS